MLPDACERRQIDCIKLILKCKTQKQGKNLPKRTRKKTKEGKLAYSKLVDAVVDNDAASTRKLLSQGCVPHIDLLFAAVRLGYHHCSKALLWTFKNIFPTA